MARRGRWIAGIVGGLGATGVVALAGSPTKTDSKAKAPVVIAPLPADVIAEAVRAEQDAVLRRYDICDRLRRLGEETKNPTLVIQADELQKQVSALYAARVARLGVKPPSADGGGPSVDGASVVPAAPVAARGAK